jgi:hypothetical protein
MSINHASRQSQADTQEQRMRLGAMRGSPWKSLLCFAGILVAATLGGCGGGEVSSDERGPTIGTASFIVESEVGGLATTNGAPAKMLPTSSATVRSVLAAAADNQQARGGWTSEGCRAGDSLIGVQPGSPYDRNGDLAICASGSDYYDNKPPADKGGGTGGWSGGCRTGDALVGVQSDNPHDKNLDLAVCWSGIDYHDNKLELRGQGGNGGWCRAESAGARTRAC